MKKHRILYCILLSCSSPADGPTACSAVPTATWATLRVPSRRFRAKVYGNTFAEVVSLKQEYWNNQ